MTMLIRVLRGLIVVVGVTTATAIVYGQTSTGLGTKTIIDENNILFSWGIVVLCIGVVAATVTAMTQSKMHIGNKDIHQSTGALAIAYANKTECVKKHESIDSNFARVHERLDEMTRIMGKIEAKLEK